MAKIEPDVPARAPKAYSYLRFSTPEQEHGDSLRRQTSLAAEYATDHGLDLDVELTFQDLGVSAFRSANAHLGRLADFMEAVRAGQVPQGSFLLVESLDRISRDHAFDAQHLLSSIIMEGVSVVTLLDKRVYSRAALQADPMGMMYSILGFMRANEESATKSRRLKEAWSEKRASIGTKPLTSKAPAWLVLDREAGRFTAIGDRAATVERIFAMTLDGIGQHKIAETFNVEGMATWGRGEFWQRSYISKVLRNPAVIGTLTPHLMDHADGQKRRKALEPVLGYYPSVVSAKDFADVQVLFEAGAASRGRHAHSALKNILAGLATCPQCSRTMTRTQKGERSKPAFVCVAAKNGAGCKPYKSVPYDLVEHQLLNSLPFVIRDQDGVEVGAELEQAIDHSEMEVSVLYDQASTLLDNLSFERSPILAARLREKEAELEGAQAAHRALLERSEAVSGRVVGSRIEKALKALRVPDGGSLDRGAANKAMRSIFKRVIINWPEATLDLEWTHGGTYRLPLVIFQPRPGPGHYKFA